MTRPCNSNSTRPRVGKFVRHAREEVEVEVEGEVDLEVEVEVEGGVESRRPRRSYLRGKVKIPPLKIDRRQSREPPRGTLSK